MPGRGNAANKYYGEYGYDPSNIITNEGRGSMYEFDEVYNSDEGAKIGIKYNKFNGRAEYMYMAPDSDQWVEAPQAVLNDFLSSGPAPKPITAESLTPPESTAEEPEFRFNSRGEKIDLAAQRRADEARRQARAEKAAEHQEAMDERSLFRKLIGAPPKRDD